MINPYARSWIVVANYLGEEYPEAFGPFGWGEEGRCKAHAFVTERIEPQEAIVTCAVMQLRDPSEKTFSPLDPPPADWDGSRPLQ